jgi:hypothetical protein
VSSEVFERSDAPVERLSVSTERSGRDWSVIGAGLAAAIVLVGLYGIGIWAIVILVETLA